ASALGQVIELTQQLRGEAGDRQVAGPRTGARRPGTAGAPRVGLAHTVGRGANASCVILTT
ncbi:MAG TPA: hypothetical protein VEZ15_15935, partial [Acidimicrobiia bacterium]|nr:hypothetical protein [Acidimicrobiia bacterium]